MRPERIFLVGLSGSGKSTVASLVAERLGWDTLDTDRQVEAISGRSIPEIFSTEGEDAFRELERAALTEAADRDRLVIATGGGAILTSEGRRSIAGGFVVWLSSSPGTSAARLTADPATEGRPLLSGDAEGRLASLLNSRRRYYELADAAIDVESLNPEQVADEVVALWNDAHGRPSPSLDRLEPDPVTGNGAASGVAATVNTKHGSASYPVIVESGALGRVGSVCREAGLRGRAFLLADAAIADRYAPIVSAALDAAGYAPLSTSIPGGESHKTLKTVAAVYDWLLDHRAERTDFLVCLGGGVVTDLGGFAAATYLRGIDFVHVPTSSLAMLDAAIGGKTGVDLPRGKNLVGAFAQPRAVVIDPDVLATLPQRHLVAGFAELIKHGLILDSRLVTELEIGASDPATFTSPRLIAWSSSIKARVVSEDEREADLRTLLNYGHTVGHAIEAVTAFGPILHGEAIAVGMRAAGLIAVSLGMLSPGDFDRQQALLRSYGLPQSAPGLDPQAVIDATLLDKKVQGGAVRWVLLESLGRATTRTDVPPGLVREAVETVLA